MFRHLFQKNAPQNRWKAQEAARTAMTTYAEAEETLARLMQNKNSLLPEFDELEGLSCEEMARLLAEVDLMMLAIAIKGSSGAVIRCIQAVTSEELWWRIFSRLAFLGPVRRIDVIAAQQAILSGMDRTAGLGDNVNRMTKEAGKMELFDISSWVDSDEIREHLEKIWSPTVWDMEQLIIHSRRPLEEKIKGLWALRRFAESREEKTKLKRMHDYLRFCLRQIRQDAPGSLYQWNLWGRTDEPKGRLHLGGGLTYTYQGMMARLEEMPASVWGLSVTRYLMGEREPEALVSFDMEYLDGRFAETGFILVEADLAQADFKEEDFEQFRLAEQRYYELPHAGPYPYPLPFATGDLIRLDLPSRRTPVIGVLYNGKGKSGDGRLCLGHLHNGRFAAFDLTDVVAMDGWRDIDFLRRADPADLPEEDRVLLELGEHIRALPSEQAVEAFSNIFGDGDK